MFEEVDQKIEPTPPSAENRPQRPKEEKDWGPFKPISKSSHPPEDLPLPSSVPPIGIPENLNIASPYPEEPRPSRAKYVVLGAIVLVVLAALIIGAIYILNTISKKNVNANENANAQANNNVNLSVNTTGNSNLNINTDLNANQGVNTNSVTKPDKDNDGIEDAFEVYLGTNPENSDSDSDGYSDLSEIRNRYNPAGAGKYTTADFKLLCSKYIAANVAEADLSANDRIKTCDIAASVFDLTNQFKLKISDAIEKDYKAECITLNSVNKSDNCEKVILLLAIIFQNFDGIYT
jgi:hypothetical protein